MNELQKTTKGGEVMKTQFKRICSILLAAVLLLTAVPGMELTTYAAQTDVNSSKLQEGGVITETEEIEAMEDDTEIENDSYMNFQFTVKGTEEEQETVLQQVKVQSLDGTEDYGTALPLTGQSEISFHVEVPDGYTIISVSPYVTDRSKKVKWRLHKDYQDNNFTIGYAYVTGKEMYEGCFGDIGDVNVRIVMERIQQKDLYIEYPDTVESVEVFSKGEKTEIVQDIAKVWNIGNVEIAVKPKEKQLVTVTYESETDSAPGTCQPSRVEEGVYYYEMGRMINPTSVLVTTETGVDVTISKDLEISAYYDDAEGNQISLDDGRVVTDRVGSKWYIYLGLDSEKMYDHNFVITNTLADGTTENIPWLYDDEMGEYSFRYEVKGESELSLKWVPKTAYQVSFDLQDAAVYEFTMNPEMEEYYPGEEYPEDTQLNVYEGRTITFAVQEDGNYVVEYVSPTGKAEDALQSVYTYNDGEYTYRVYRYKPTADTVITVKRVPGEKYNVTILSENATVYSFYYGNEDGDETYVRQGVWEDCSVKAQNKVYFGFNYDSTYKLESVMLSDGKEQQLERVAIISEDEETYYYIYSFVPTADSTVRVNVVPKEKYTLNFDLQDATVTGFNFATTEDVQEYELDEGKYTFFVNATDDTKQVKLVTTTGDETGELVPHYDVDEGRYYYCVELAKNTTIYVTTETKEQHEIQFNFENATIKILSESGVSTENGYLADYGSTFSFRVTPDEGYKILKVSVTGENAQTLYPVVNETNHVYALKVGCDATIQIETVKKVVHTVNFETINASVECTQLMENEGVYTTYEGEIFTFTAEPETGYVLDTVVVNGEKLQALYDSQESKCYYQTAASENLTIEVTAVEAAEHKIVFNYETDVVDTIKIWSQEGQQYTLEDGEVVVDGTESVWFDIEGDTGNIAKVICTDALGETKTIYNTAYDGNVGYYLGCLTKDVQISIVSGETYSVTFPDMEEVTIVPVEGFGVLANVIYVPNGESLQFQVQPASGYCIRSVKASGAKITGNSKTGQYELRRSSNKYSELDVNIMLWELPEEEKHKEYLFDYSKKAVSLSAFVAEEEIALVNNAMVMPVSEIITVKVKALGNQLVNLYENDVLLEPVSTEEDGTIVYEVVSSIVTANSVKLLRVETYDYHTVEFASNDTVEFLVEEIDEYGETVWNTVDSTFKVKANEVLKFKVDVASGYKLQDVFLEDETAGKIEKKTDYDGLEDVYDIYYTVKPLKDAVIGANVEEIPAHNYNFVYDSEKVDLYIGEYSYYYDDWDYDIYWEECGSEYRKTVAEGIYNNVMFKVVPKDGYTVSLVSTTEDSSGAVSKRYDGMSDSYYYALANTEDATIYISAMEQGSYNVTFESGIGVNSISLYLNNGNEIISTAADNTLCLSNTENIFVIPEMETLPTADDFEISKYQITSISVNGKELVKEYNSDYEAYGYTLPSFEQDITVVIETGLNPHVVNNLTIDREDETDLYQVYYYVEREDEEGNSTKEKVYLNPEDSLQIFGRNQAIGIEPVEGYGIAKVEFSRDGRVKTLTPNEEGLYDIWYPLSMGLEGTITVSTYTEKVEAQTVVVEGITDGKVSQAVDTVKDYNISFAPADADLSQIGVEVVVAEGQPADVVTAEIIAGSLRLTTAACENSENAATVKIYDLDARTGEKTYIQGGTFHVSTISPTALEEGTVKAEVISINDVSVKLGLTAPEGLTELNKGMYYYKVVITPQETEGKEIPDEIKNATRNPFYIAKEGEYREISLSLNRNSEGNGQAWNYDITVSMVQTTDNSFENITEKELFESNCETLSVSTKNPYYQEKVTFKNQVKQIYTTQENVAVAQVVFDVNNSNPKVAEVKDITELNGKGSALSVWEENGIIYTAVPSDAMVGKHTVEVTLDAPAHMNKTVGTFSITVVKGIENMTVTIPSVEIYKQTGKTATVKASLVYNQDTTAPKTKKATWEIVKANGEAFAESDALYGMLTMKNGTVTVNKGFVPSETESENQFCIKVKAADYTGNPVFATSEVITLRNKPTEIGAIYVVTPIEGGYQVVVKDGSIITSDKLENTFVVALKDEAEEKEFYTEEELNSLCISPEILTYKSSNKAVSVEKTEEVTLNATKTAKNVKLTITANDGGKKKAVMKFTVDYAAPEALALEVANGTQVLPETATREVSFAGTTNTRLMVKVKQKTEDNWTDLDALVNYKLSIKGGKIVSSDTVNGIYEIVVTGKTATVTLDNKTTGAKAKEVYKITNTAYSANKAPKTKTSSKLICGSLAERSVTYTLSGTYDFKDKYVLVETDYLSKNKKTEENYNQFESAATNLNTLIPITEGKFTLNFNENTIPAGSYKLKLTFGTGNDAESFAADAKPVTVTLKAVKPKVIKGSFSPTKSYKIEAKAGASVVLAGKGKNLVENSLVYKDLKNANIKGKQNNFLSYFELKDNQLCLRSDLTPENITYLKSKAGKNDLTAYITYSVAYGNDGYGNATQVNKTIKLTVKLK